MCWPCVAQVPLSGARRGDRKPVQVLIKVTEPAKREAGETVEDSVQRDRPQEGGDIRYPQGIALNTFLNNF